MKITKLQIKNLLGLKEFSANGGDLELTGKNGAGKTSVIDAIKYALTNKSDREFVITKGATEGEVLIETDTGLRVHRKVREGKTDYKSIRQGTDKEEKNESFLREIFTELQLDPIAFAGMDEKEQNRIILDLIDFKWDLEWVRQQFGELPPEVNYDQNILCVLHDIQSEDGYYFRRRQDINREGRNKQAFIAEIGEALPAGYDAATWEKVNLGDLYKQIETIRSKNEWIDKAKRAVAGRDNKIRGFEAELEIAKNAIDRETLGTRTSLEKQIAEMQARINSMRKDLESLEEKRLSRIELAKKTYEGKVAEFDGEVRQYEDLARQEPASFAELQEKAEMSERMKSFVNEHHRMLGLQEDVSELRKQSEDLTAKIELARSLPGQILANANIPIPGLEIKDGIPLINGLPVSNLSEGEKFALCIGIAVQREGALNMVLLDGIERLDSTKRKDAYALLKSKGVQFLASRTSDDDTLKVVHL